MAAIFSHNDSFEWTAKTRIRSKDAFISKELLLKKYRLALANKAKVS